MLKVEQEWSELIVLLIRMVYGIELYWSSKNELNEVKYLFVYVTT